MPTKTSPADELALECVRAYAELRRAAGVLHDDVGSLLAVAGLRLQLLCMDFPEASERAAEASEAIGGAMEHVRKLSRALEPSPGPPHRVEERSAGSRRSFPRESRCATRPR